MNERARFYLIWAWRAQLGPPEWGRKDMGWGWPGDTVCVCAAEWRHILGMLATGARRVSESGGGREQMGPESGHAKRPPPLVGTKRTSLSGARARADGQLD